MIIEIQHNGTVIHEFSVGDHVRPEELVVVTGRIKLPKETREVTVKRIIRASCDHFGLKVCEISAKSRKRDNVLARKIAMYLIRKTMPSYGFKDIAEMFGRRDHTTAIYSVKYVEKKLSMKYPDEVVDDLKAIKEKI